MIYDKLENAPLYYGLHERFKSAFDFLKMTDFNAIDCGKYEIDGNSIYAIVQDYQTKTLEQAKFEVHKKYIDIQFIVEGKERLGFAPIGAFSQSTFYDDTKDIAFGEAQGEFISATSGDFVIFYPTDAHMPSVCEDEPAYVKKVVVKILS